MEVVLLGTGSADGWPNPFCTCASCGDARRTGSVRGQTGALVDGHLLIDCGPEVPRSAERLGHSLTSIDTLLFTHAHPDHFGPAALLFREWSTATTELNVIGPPAVIAACEHWVDPQAIVRFIPVTSGESVLTPGLHITGRAANHHGADIGPALIYDVEASDGRLLYATDTGPLPAETISALAHRRFDIALIEETFGHNQNHDGDHLDLKSFADTIRELRNVAAITDNTQVVAIHLSHHNPPTPELRQILQTWGADVVDDGAILRSGHQAPTLSRPNRRLVIGGARSGKSAFAEQLLAAEPQVKYVATARVRPDDLEWQARVEHHRAGRPRHWETLETDDVAGLLLSADNGDVLLVDCLTLWLTQVFDDTGGWNGDTSGVAKRLEELVVAWRKTAARVVAVSNEVGWGVVPDSAAGRLFRDWQGRLNAAVARDSDEVTLMVAGRAIALNASTVMTDAPTGAIPGES